MISAPPEREFALKRFGELFFDDLGGGAGKRQPDIGHRYDNLRLLLTRRDDHGKQTKQQHTQHDERGEFTVDKEGRDATRQAVWGEG
jgi:hypothetical protein